MQAEEAAMSDSRILIVEDVRGHGEPLADFLREAGYEVFRVDAGSRAIAAAYDFKPNLVVFDVAHDIQRALTVASTLAWVDDLRVAVVTEAAPDACSAIGTLLSQGKAWMQAPALDGSLLRRIGQLLPAREGLEMR
jgi:DNA-binding response OmpR family regulator